MKSYLDCWNRNPIFVKILSILSNIIINKYVIRRNIEIKFHLHKTYNDYIQNL